MNNIKEIFGNNNEKNGDGRIQTLIREFDDAKNSESELKARYEKVKEKRMAKEIELYKALENEGLQSVRTGDRGTFYRSNMFFASCSKEYKEALFVWLNNVGAGRLIAPDIHPKRLSSFIKERLENDLDIPEFVSTHFKETIGRRKN